MGKESFKTKLALLWMNLSNEPLIALYSLIPFILRKELGASTFEISLFTILTPVLSVFSFYWGAWLAHRRSRLLSNLIGAWILSRLPLFFFPYIENFWTMFVCCGIYQLFSRASTPALMEILKRNIPKKNREYTFSLYYVLSAIEGTFIGIFLTQVLAASDDNWRVIFLISALISFSSVILQLRIKMPREEIRPPVAFTKELLIEPIKDSFRLLRNRPDFACFQWGFMIGGFALMIIAPVRSIFTADVLPISIADLTIARCVFVGLGIAGSSLIWRKGLERYGIHQLTVWILLGFGLFPLFFLLSSLHISWFYLAHFVYGIAQGGSHLVWHLSGTIFAREENSTLFTTVNILMIGIRGAIGPLLGGLLCDLSGPVPVLALGAGISLLGAWYVFKQKSKYTHRDLEIG